MHLTNYSGMCYATCLRAGYAKPGPEWGMMGVPVNKHHPDFQVLETPKDLPGAAAGGAAAGGERVLGDDDDDEEEAVGGKRSAEWVRPPPIVLLPAYGMSGNEVGYGATECVVLRYGMELRNCGTEVGYGATNVRY